MEISIAATVASPAQAAPRSGSARVPGGSFVPLPGLVMMPRTGMDSRSRKLLPSLLEPGTIGVTGTR